MESISEQPEVTVFVCANCTRPGEVPTSAGRTRPAVPDFGWPGFVKQIIVPCAGRIQPEHILRVFESGSSVVSVIACQEDNCHQAEGSRRCTCRLDYTRSLLNEIGLGDERLLLLHLPGSAQQDLALVAGRPVSEPNSDLLKDQIVSVRDQVLEVMRSCPPNPLQACAKTSESSPADAAAGGSEV
jgi:F420-non-reducing hydrogenase iron-sulfur subunit